MASEGASREALRFSVMRKNAALQRAFRSLDAQTQKALIEHAEAKARHRGFKAEMIGWRLSVLRARNEALEEDFPDVEKRFPEDYPRTSQEAREEDDGWANRE